MSRPRLLDLFCGAGGAAEGYHQAGFDVVGVDIKPQPHYPFEFIKCDALDYFRDAKRLTYLLGEIDAIHASPVCKLWSRITRTNPAAAGMHNDGIAPLRPLLAATGLPYVIENVPEAPLIDPVLLCGSMFDLDVKRHRGFETNWRLQPPWRPCRHRIWTKRFSPNRSDRRRNPGVLSSVVTVAGHGGGAGQHVEDWRRAMVIDWMTRDELAQAIPPAYTEFIGAQLLAVLAGVAS